MQQIAWAQSLYPVLKDGTWRLVDASDSSQVSEEYTSLCATSDPSVFIGGNEGKYRLITSDTCSAAYDQVVDLVFARYAILENGEWRIANHHGTVFVTGLDSVKVSQHGQDIKLYKSGKAGIYVPFQEVIIPPNYEVIGRFDHTSAYLVKQNGNVGVINSNGEVVIPIRYHAIYPFSKTLVRLEKDDLWGVGSITDTRQIEPHWERCKFLGGNYLIGYEKQGAELYRFPSVDLICDRYDDYFHLHGKYIGVKRENKVGIIDENGVEVIPPMYEWIAPIRDGLFIITQGDKKGLINGQNKILIEPKYDDLSDMSRSTYFRYKIGGKYGVVQQGGPELTPPIYTGAMWRDDGHIMVRKRSLVGLINTAGELVVPVQYHAIGPFKNNVALTLVRNCFGLVNQDTIIASPKNDFISLTKGVAKIYRSDTLEVVELEANGAVYDRYNYVGLDSYNVLKKAPLSIEKQPESVLSDEMIFYDLRYSKPHQKWGIWDKKKLEFIAAPCYDRIISTGYASFFVVEKFTEPYPFSYAGLSFEATSTYGVVSLFSGVDQFDCSLVYAKIDKSGGTYGTSTSTTRVLKRDGTWGFMTQSKSSSITGVQGDFVRIRRFMNGGQASLGTYDENHSMESIGHLINDITQQGTIHLQEDSLIDKYIDNDLYVNVYGGQWGYEGFTLDEHFYSPYKGMNTYSSAQSFNTRRGIHSAESGVSVFNERRHDMFPRSYESIEFHNVLADSGHYIVSEIKPVYGFINDAGERVIDCAYDSIGDFNSGLAVLQIGKQFGAINTSADTVVRGIYTSLGPFVNGVAIALKDGRYGAIDTRGAVVAHFNYTKMTRTNDGEFLVKGKTGYGVLNAEGNVVVPLTWKKIIDINSAGDMVVKSEDGYGVVSRSGEVLVKPKYDRIGRFTNDSLIAVKHHKAFALFNYKTSDRITKFKYRKMEVNGRGLVLAKKGSRYGFIDGMGEISLAFIYRKATLFNHGVAMVRKKKGYLMINESGDQVNDERWLSYEVKPTHIIASNDSMKWLLSEKGKKLFLIDSVDVVDRSLSRILIRRADGNMVFVADNGTPVIAQVFEQALPFKKGRASVKVKGKWGVINTAGEYLLTPQYHSVNQVSAERTKVAISPLYGMTNFNGGVLVEPQFESIDYVNKAIRGKLNGRYGYYNFSGQPLLPLSK